MKVKSFHVTLSDSGYEIFYRIVDKNNEPLTQSFICSCDGKTSQRLQHLDKFNTVFRNIESRFWTTVLAENNQPTDSGQNLFFYLEIRVYKNVSLDDSITQRTLAYSGLLGLNESLNVNEEIECKISLTDCTNSDSSTTLDVNSSSVYVTLQVNSAISEEKQQQKSSKSFQRSTLSLVLPKIIQPDFNSNFIFIQLKQLNLHQTDYKYYRVVVSVLFDNQKNNNNQNSESVITLGSYRLVLVKQGHLRSF